MANTIARAKGFTKAGEQKAAEATRIGAGAAQAEAATWRTFATAMVWADGRVEILVRRDGKIIHQWETGKES